MKKISFIVADIYTFGGVQKVTNIISNNLSEKKYEISIISLFKSSDTISFQFDDNIKIKYIIDGKLHFKKKYFQIVKKIRNFFKNDDSQVLIISGVGMLTAFYPALINLKKKIIVWDHQGFYFGKKFGLEWIGKRISAKYCEKLVVITQTSFENYKRNIGNNNIEMIYNPIEYKRKKIEYNENSKMIISCGRLEYQKGFDMLIDIGKNIFNEYKEWEWHIWGEGSKKSELQKKIKENNLENNIKLCGYTDDIKLKYKNYSMYVMTSRHEGLPVVLLEAQINKLPLISFDCETGPSEIIRDNKNGYLIECFDLIEMSMKIKELIKNENKRKSFSNNGLMDIEKFKLKTVILKWENLIDEL